MHTVVIGNSASVTSESRDNNPPNSKVPTYGLNRNSGSNPKVKELMNENLGGAYRRSPTAGARRILRDVITAYQ
jgi:hypothetical protein